MVNKSKRHARNKHEHETQEEHEKHNAVKTLKYFFELSENFSNVKKLLATRKNYYINYLFSLLGYSYKGSDEHVNILHLSAQAWLLGVFDELQSEILRKNSANQSLTYKETLKHIRQIIVEENVFLDNIKLLTGVFHLDEPSLKDGRIFKQILVNIQATKTEILKELPHEEINQTQFADLLFKIFTNAFNYFLNDYNSFEEDKKSLLLLNILEKYQEDTADRNAETFKNRYYKEKELNEESLTELERKRLNLQLEQYFYFSESSNEELLDEIELFNKNSVNILFKITSLANLKNIKQVGLKYFDLLLSNSHWIETKMKNLKLERVLEFTKALYSNGVEIYNKGKEKLNERIEVLRVWGKTIEESVDNNPLVKDFRAFTSRVYEQGYKNVFQIPREFIQDKVLQPGKNLLLRFSSNSVEIVIEQLKVGKEKSKELFQRVLESLKNSYSSLTGIVFGKDALIKVDYQTEEEYMKITISKKLLLLDPRKFRELILSFVQFIKDIDYEVIPRLAIDYTSEKYNNAKKYVINTYRRFLDLADEEEVSEVEMTAQEEKKNN
jgi:hypothetical protein